MKSTLCSGLATVFPPFWDTVVLLKVIAVPKVLTSSEFVDTKSASL